MSQLLSRPTAARSMSAAMASSSDVSSPAIASIAPIHRTTVTVMAFSTVSSTKA